MEDFLIRYGYMALLVATFFGGEEGVILGGFLARAGYFNLFWTAVIAAIGGSLGDQFYFRLARSRGLAWVQKSKRLSRNYPKAITLVERYGTWIVLCSRFLAGLRITIPIVCALSKMPPYRYTMMNLLSAALWATTFSVGAYYVGPAIFRWLKLARSGWYWVLAGLALVGVLWYLRRRYRRRWKERERGREGERER
jgi:membrane protein DedA with SNARE-associated domain